MEEKKYNPTFSIMKGIAILSVVVGHCTMSKFVEAYVNQYHLAAFFFVAGYFLTDKYVLNPVLLIKKRVYSLYIPYIISCLGCLILHNALYKVYIYDNPLTISEMLDGGASVILKLSSLEPLMGAMWFCPVLLFTSIFSALVLWFCKRYASDSFRVTIIAMVLFVALGEVSLKVFHLKSPYMIWQNMIISGILFEGWLFHQYGEKYIPKKKIVLVSIGTFIAFLLIVFVSHDWLFNLQAAHLKEVSAVLLLIVAFLGSMMVYVISLLLSKSEMGKLLAIVGNHSFSIMLLHFVSFKVVNVMMCLEDGMPLTKIASFPTIPYQHIGWCFVYVVVGCALPIGMVKIKDYMLFVIKGKLCFKK